MKTLLKSKFAALIVACAPLAANAHHSGVTEPGLAMVDHAAVWLMVAGMVFVLAEILRKKRSS